MNQIDAKLISARIREVALRETELPEATATDVAFHMTDWLDDLDAFHRFCSRPSAISDREVSRLLTEFLVHVPNHLAAAAKLYTNIPVTDIFGVGATSEGREND